MNDTAISYPIHTEWGSWLLMHDIDQIFFAAVSFACIMIGFNQFLDCLKRIQPVLGWFYSWIPSIKQLIVITFLMVCIFVCMWIYLTTHSYIHTASDYLRLIPNSLSVLGKFLIPRDVAMHTPEPSELTYWAFMKSLFISVIPSSSNQREL